MLGLESLVELDRLLTTENNVVSYLRELKFQHKSHFFREMCRYHSADEPQKKPHNSRFFVFAQVMENPFIDLIDFPTSFK